MSWKINILILLTFSFSCGKEKVIKPDLNNKKPILENEFIIEAESLKQVINNKHIKIIDFRKKENYNIEHIKKAVQMWRTDIEDTTYPYKGMKANAKQIEKLFGSLGISSLDTIVVYDNKGLCETSRLWWILQIHQFKNIKMLHGGLKAWKAINGPVTNKKTNIEPSNFKLSDTKNLEYYVSKEQVLKAINNNNTILLDTRTTNEFNGTKIKKEALKAGRIANSIHLDWAEAIHYNTDKKLKSIETLKNIYINKLKLKKNDSIILYCHSGVRSAHTTFVLTQLLGFKNVKNYDGSWIEWSHFKELPFKIN